MELLLHVKPLQKERNNRVLCCPLGSIISGYTERHIKIRWIRYIGWHYRPDGQKPPGFEYASQCLDLHLQKYADIYQAMLDVIERGKPTASAWNKAIDDAWLEFLKDGRVEETMPDDPRGDVPVISAMVWTETERKLFLGIKINEELMFKEAKEQIVKKHDFEHGGKTYSSPRFKFDWENDLGLSTTTLNQIRDNKFAFHPRLNIKVNPALKTEIISG